MSSIKCQRCDHIQSTDDAEFDEPGRSFINRLIDRAYCTVCEPCYQDWLRAFRKQFIEMEELELEIEFRRRHKYADTMQGPPMDLIKRYAEARVKIQVDGLNWILAGKADETKKKG